jgi:hypothetical protein
MMLPREPDRLSKLLIDIDEFAGNLILIELGFYDAVERELLGERRLKVPFFEAVQSFRYQLMASSVKLTPLAIYLSPEEVKECQHEYEQIEDRLASWRVDAMRFWSERRGWETSRQGETSLSLLVPVWRTEMSWDLSFLLKQWQIKNPTVRNLGSVFARLRERVTTAIESMKTAVDQKEVPSNGIRYTVTLDEAAAIVSRSKHTLRKYGDLPTEVNRTRKRGQPAEYYYDEMRPFLAKHFARDLPDIPPRARGRLG